MTVNRTSNELAFTMSFLVGPDAVKPQHHCVFRRWFPESYPFLHRKRTRTAYIATARLRVAPQSKFDLILALALMGGIAYGPHLFRAFAM